MAAKKKQDTHAEANVWEAKQQFCKEQIIVSERYRDHRDLVDALLEDGEKYTFEEVDSLIEKYKKEKMAEYSKLVITQTGRALIAKIIAGTGDIEFTKVCSSSAAYTEGELESLTELEEVRQTSLVSNVSRTNDVAIKIEAAFSNAELTEGYDMRTLGLYAVDPDEGEILYAVCIETAGSCYMPPCNGVTVSAASIQLYTAVGNSDHVSLEVDPGAFATIRDIRLLEEAMSALDEMLCNKVDKAEGKGLSEHDYTTADKDKLDKIASGICKTPQGTTVKTVECPDFELRDGARVMVTFNNGNTSNYMKLNVNGTGEYFAYFPIDGFRAYNHELISKLIVAGCAYEFIFQDAETNASKKWVYCGVVGTAESIGALPVDGNAASATRSRYIIGDSLSSADEDIFLMKNNNGDYSLRTTTDSTKPQGNSISFSATKADCAATLGNAGNANSTHMAFNWNGQNGQPSWVWGGNDGISMYVYNPSNFNVNSAQKDGSGNVIADTYLPKSGGLISTLSSEGTIHLECMGSQGMDFYSNQSHYDLVSNYFQSGHVNVGDGFICAQDIDNGNMLYIAHGGSCAHDFLTYNYQHVLTGAVTLLDGKVVAANGFKTSYADYAENWEYQDGNPNSEDRVGLFVTFAGNKVRIAQKGDNLVKVGVISATPSILGDSDGKEWTKKYKKDVYGRDIWEDVEQEDGTVVKDRVLNPAYDETQKYIKRADRPEWDAVGTHGKLVVRDDGTCQPDGFCVPTDGGIATAADEGFYVMERLDESHIRIYMR